MASRVRTSLLFVLLLSLPATANAQGLADVLVTLLRPDIILAPPPPSGTSHEAHFSNQFQDDTAIAFNRQMVTQLATFPTGSSSGGFSFVRDPGTGRISRASDSFGPSFSERALTAGRGWFSFGMNLQYSKYDRFNDINTESGDLQFYLRHQDTTGNNFFEGDLIRTDLRLKLSTTTASFLLNYGLTDRFDVSATVPIVHASLDASVVATILRLSTATTPGPLVHAFAGAGDPTTRTFTGGGTSTGIGDILLRGKYRFKDLPGGGLAIGVDIRTPTGSAEDLLGTGAAQVAINLIASSTRGKIAPHVNIGYTLSGDSDVIGEVPNEFGYRGGVEFVVNPNFTISGDVIGRSLLDSTLFDLGQTTWTYRDFAGVTASTNFDEFQQSSGTLHIASAAIGGKFNVTGNFLISASVLFPLNSSGIRARVTPVFGFEYSFEGSRK